MSFGAFFIFAAFVMLLVVSVSAPVWSAVAFLTVQFQAESVFSETIRATFGNWGYCIWEDGRCVSPLCLISLKFASEVPSIFSAVTL